MQPWHAEHPVQAPLAERLVHGQFPEFCEIRAERVGTGWDTDVWSFGPAAFRFPRRAFGVKTVLNEQRVLPRLAPRLNVPIPVPKWMGRACDDFGFAFYGHDLLPGRTADRARLSRAARADMAPALADFLKGLHGVDTAEALRMGARPDSGRAGVARRLATVVGILNDVQDTLPFELVRALRSLLNRPVFESLDTPCLIHGDLYARHLLVDAQGALTGVIDWGDVCCGDPSADLALVYTWLPASARAGFFEAYGPVDAQTLARARAIAACYGARLLAYAHDIEDPDLKACALIALRGAVE